MSVLALASYCLGLLAHILPGLAASAGARVGLHPEESVPLALGSLTLLLLLLPALPVRLARVGGATVQCLACLQLSAIMAALSLYNISLAIFIAIPLVPLAILASQFSRWSIPRIILR